MKHMNKRLFLFASYDKENKISDELLYYLNSLSDIGDIIFVMDNPVEKEELNKIKKIKNILFYNCERHGEYDFGSYKRGYEWAKSKNILKNYDWIYFVNDSVYMLSSPEQKIIYLENQNSDFIGMYSYQAENIPEHIQSWFVGISKKIYKEKFFIDFIENISKQKSKKDIINKYEIGLSQLLLRNGYKSSVVKTGKDIDDTRTQPVEILKSGIPFIKRAALQYVSEPNILYPYTTNYGLVDKIITHGITKKSYRNIFNISLFGIPVITIKQKEKLSEYKIYLLKYIPIIKIKK